MGMINSTQARLRSAGLLLASIALLAMVGCKGEKDAPFGSSITIEETEKFFVLGAAFQYPNLIRYRVTVLDPDGLPMSGVEVQLDTFISAGESVTINGQTGNAGQELISTLTMGSGGFKEFELTAPSQVIRVLLAPSASASGALVGTTGKFADGSYAYVVSAVDAVGGEALSPETTPVVVSNATSSIDQITVSWTAVTGAVSYNVYGRTPGGEGLLATGIGTAVTSFVDNATATPSGALPGTPGTFNSTGVAANTIRVGIAASSGSTQAVVDSSIY